MLENHQLDFIPAEIGMEEDLAILLASFGIFLEHRWLLERVYPEGVPEPVAKFDLKGRKFGILLILLAVLIECFDMAFLALNTWGLDHSGLKYFEVALLFAGNVLAVVGVTRFSFEIVRPG